MDVERWCETITIDCPSTGTSVTAHTSMIGVPSSNSDSKYSYIYGELHHCNGAAYCGLHLPVSSIEPAGGMCPVIKPFRKKLGDV